MVQKGRQAPPQTPLKLKITVDEAREKITERIEKGKRLLQVQIESSEQLKQARNEYYKWSGYNTELLKQLFSNESIAQEYDWFGIAVIGGRKHLLEEVEKLQDDINEKIRRLDSIAERLELIPVADDVSSVINKPTPAVKRSGSKVFVVHGHNEATRETMARFLERLGLEPIILHEQASGGRTIIEKLEHYADVNYAVVILTPDDEGRKKGEGELHQDRARQNVILELGYFTGKLGRRRVCALYSGRVEIPTDYLGVLYIPFDEGKGWQLQLAKELRAAGFFIDMNKAI